MQPSTKASPRKRKRQRLTAYVTRLSGQRTPQAELDGAGDMLTITGYSTTRSLVEGINGLGPALDYLGPGQYLVEVKGLYKDKTFSFVYVQE